MMPVKTFGKSSCEVAARVLKVLMRLAQVALEFGHASNALRTK
jgi:hypothetical protein